MEKERLCCIGKLLNEKCDLNVHCRLKGRIKLSEISKEDLELLKRRAGHNVGDNDEICFHHERSYLSRFEALQKYCCDPFNGHKKKISKGLRKVDDTIIEKLKLSQDKNCVEIVLKRQKMLQQKVPKKANQKMTLKMNILL